MNLLPNMRDYQGNPVTDANGIALRAIREGELLFLPVTCPTTTIAEARRALWDALARAEANNRTGYPPVINGYDDDPYNALNHLTDGTGTFGDALVALKVGKSVSRPDWGSPVSLEGDKFHWTVHGPTHGYEPSTADLLASDWRVLP